MNRLQTFRSALMLSVLVLPSVAAAEAKTVAVVSIFGYDNLLKDAAVLGTAVGLPGLDKMLDGQVKQGTGGKGIPGLDKTKPWGAIIAEEDGNIKPLVFLPIADAKGFLAALGLPGEDAGDGLMQIITPAGPGFVKSKGGWAFISNQKQTLGDLPADPAKELGDLPKKYAIAVKIFFPNLSVKGRNKLLGGLRGLSELGAGFGGDDPGVQADAIAAQIAQLEQLLDEADSATLGLKVDQANKSFVLEAQLTALPETSFARQMARFKKSPSKFAGFLRKDAAVSALFTMKGKPTDEEIAQLEKQYNEAKTRALKQIDEEDDIPDEAKAALKKALTKLIDVGFDTAKSGNMDGGMVLVLQPKPAFVAGGFVTDPKAIESALKELAALVEEEPDFPKIKWNSGSHKGYTLHTMKFPVPDENAVQILGDEVDVILAVGKDSLYLAGGASAAMLLKKVVDDSSTGPTEPQPPFQLTIALGPILELAATQDETGMVKGIAAQVAALKGKDRIRITGEPIERGLAYRLEIEEGVLKAVGFPLQMLMQAGGGPGM